jgi:ABC-type Fe3+-hydroxamate transport system substrate-binding protein
MTEVFQVLAASPAQPTEATDWAGVTHPKDFASPRIISLVPSLTELLCSLGLACHLVGRTGFCIHPRHVLRNVPKVGGTKNVNIERIKRLAPTHVIVNVDENTRETALALRSVVPHVVVTHPLTVKDNLALYALFGELFGAREKAAELSLALTQRLDACKARAEPLRGVLYLIWKDPYMTVSKDTYIADMLLQGGMEQIGFDSKSRYPEIDIKPAAARASAILLSSEPYRFGSADQKALSTDTAKPVLLVDGEMMSWYGSRAISGLDYVHVLKAELEKTLHG